MVNTEITQKISSAMDALRNLHTDLKNSADDIEANILLDLKSILEETLTTCSEVLHGHHKLSK